MSVAYNVMVSVVGNAENIANTITGNSIAIRNAAEGTGSITGVVTEVVGAVGGVGGVLIKTAINSPAGPALGDIIDITAAVTALVPGLQPLSVALTIGGIIYNVYDEVQLPNSKGRDFWGRKVISFAIGNTPDPLVKTVRYVDPLILDLDADGLEITRLNAAPPVLFDADADIIRTATAWAGADDGFLVLDRDGNGSIESGRELFGDETLLANGSKAANGFAALSELDTNADGVFSAADAQFDAVRVWRDLNQDGISQSGELKSLADSGVQSVNLSSAASNLNYGDALLVRNGSFTRIDGSSGQAGSFILAQNNFIRAFAPVSVSQEAKALPNIGGTGWVRDLQEAATQRPELIGLLDQVPERGHSGAVQDRGGAVAR